MNHTPVDPDQPRMMTRNESLVVAAVTAAFTSAGAMTIALSPNLLGVIFAVLTWASGAYAVRCLLAKGKSPS